MRIDLTVRTAGNDVATEVVDLAVVARPGTTWRELAGPVGAAAGAVPQWSDGRRLAADDVLGREPLVTGAVLGVDRVRPVASARLEVVGGAGCGAGIALRPGTLIIGRDRSCDLVLADPLVSRRHARLDVSAAGITVRDLDSTGGTVVGGMRVAAAALERGVPVRLGAGFVAITGLDTAQPPMAPAEIELPAPPPPAQRTRIPLVAALLPTALGGGLAAATGSWELLAFAALTPVATLAGAVGDRLSGRRRARRARRAHREASERAETEIATRLRAEGATRRAEFDHPAALLRTLGGPVTPRPGTAAAAVVRIGLGTAPSRLRCRTGGEARSAGPVPDVPIAVDLGAPVVMSGPADVRRDLVRWIALQVLAVAPGEVALDWPTPSDTERGWLDRVPAAELSTATRTLTIRTTPTRDEVTLADRHDTDRQPTVVEVSALGAVRVVAPGAGPVEGYADRVEPGLAVRIARAVARRAAGAPTAGIPAACRLVELLDVATAADLTRHWRADDGTARTVLGLAADGTVVVDLDRDGPHLLVAGCTGSGKSELLQCLVAGLAARCSPALLSFLLVDFKGGAAFADCARLPHTVGLVTDLDAAAGIRVLAWLDAELRRRERLFAAAGVSDLAGYRRGGHRLDRLVVAVDEFAALADELPAFVPGLVGVARRGRSLGVHLVLATQRPAGVVSPEIRANTALRICLRVTGAADSTDVIDSPAAAAIPSRLAGRAYLRSSEGLREVQLAGVSGRCSDPDEIRVVRIDRPGERDLQSDERETELQRLVETARAAADPADRVAACGPWLPPLADRLELSELPPPPTGQVAIGVVDLPAQQRQPALALDLATGGVVAVAGAARSGRSSALVTIATAAAAALGPAQLQVYGIDARRGLAALHRLAHTGTVAALGDGFGFVARLIERLGELVGTQHGAHVLIAVDGWEQVVAASDEYDAGRTADRLADLARLAASGAATLVVAGGRGVLSPRLGAPAQHRLVLSLGDASDYQLAGVPASAVPPRAVAGRAVRVADAATVQFALAAPRPSPAPLPEPAALRLRPLPVAITLAELPSRAGRVTLGVGGDRAAPVQVDLDRGGSVLISGPPRSGRTSTLRAVLAQSAAVRLVVAPLRSPLTAAARSVGVPVLTPSATQWSLPDTGAVLVDDVEQCADRPLGDDLARWAADGRTVVAAGRSDALAVAYRGLVAQLRGSGAGLVLHPAPGDADLFGVAIPRSREPQPPGRGVLVPDPAWGLDVLPLPIQVATP